jgi:diguanylate cyclase (GGDEF)-like protein
VSEVRVDELDAGASGPAAEPVRLHLAPPVVDLRDGVALPADAAARDREEARRERQAAARDRALAAEYLRQAYRDGLTGTLQRDAGRQQLEHEVERARRGGGPMSMAFLDVVGLKQLNDTRGHSAGDDLLRSVGTALITGLRVYDVVVRWGGDEFVCALVDTPMVSARERLGEVTRRLAASHIQVSVGFSELEGGDSLAELVERADLDLYRRRRRLQVARDVPDPPVPSGS